MIRSIFTFLFVLLTMVAASQTSHGYTLRDYRFSFTFPRKPERIYVEGIPNMDTYQYIKPGGYTIQFSTFSIPPALSTKSTTLETIAKGFSNAYIKSTGNVATLLNTTYYTLKSRKYAALLYMLDQNISAYSGALIFLTYTPENAYVITFYTNDILNHLRYIGKYYNVR